MGFFDVLDSRKGIARGMAKVFKHAHQTNPQLSTQDIIELALQSRYSVIGLNSEQAEIYRAGRHSATDIFTLCHFIAEIELLSHLNVFDRFTLRMEGENIVEHTRGVIDRELIRLGFSR